MNTPDVCVVIATRDRADDLSRTLQSLQSCDRPPAVREILIVDNGRAGGPGSRVEALVRTRGARYLWWPRGGKSVALNRALEELRDDDLVFFTDDDVEVGSRTLRAYADAARGVLSGTMYGGDLEVEYEVEPPGWLVPYLPRSATGQRGAKPAGALAGANWAAFVADLRACGGFHPALGPGSVSGATGQETWAQRRLAARGVRAVHVPDAVVVHRVPAGRCSPEWAIDRTEREGVHDGLLEASIDPHPMGRWLPRPASLARASAALLLRHVAAMVREDEEARFRARLDQAYMRGYARGVRHARAPLDRLTGEAARRSAPRR